MNVHVLIFIIIFVVALGVTIYLKKCLEQFNRQFKRQLDANALKLNNLEKFSYDIYFNPMPNSVDVTNPYECTPAELKPCKVNDFTTCVGCKNLIATCTHFSRDTKFIDADGNVSIIPKNDTKNDGYCLVTQTLAQRCNPHHGDMVLVRVRPNDLECVLICECKHPGYIGKTSIDGSCENVFVCDGKVKQLNVPFEKLECDCGEGFQGKPGTLSCQESTVENFKNYDSLHYEYDTLPSNYFNNYINANFPGNRLKDPCKYCLITGLSVNGTAVPTADGGYTCRAEDAQAIPIRSGSEVRMLKGSSGPDAMLKINWEWILMYGKITSPDFNNMAAIFSKSKNLEICRKLGIDETENEWFAINLLQHQVRYPGHFGHFAYDKVPIGKCYPNKMPGISLIDSLNLFRYSCLFSTTRYGNKRRNFEDGYYREYEGESHPRQYLWNYQIWDSVELDVNPVVSIDKEADGMYQFKLNKYLRDTSNVANDIKLLFLAFRPSKGRIDVVTTTDHEDYQRYKGKLISKYT